MKPWILIIYIFTSFFSTYAQKVLVIDDQNNPIGNVAVFNKTKTKSTLSNNHGYVNLSRFLVGDSIFFQHPNYNLQQLIKNNITTKVQLTTKINTLGVVDVKANKNTNNIRNTAEKKIFISSKEIAQLNGTNTADLLEKRGGISVQRSQMGGGSPNIRGFEANRVLLMIDGVRLNNAIYRSGHLQNIMTIDEFILEDMEIIFGPSSVLYGSDALGGTIHMKTKKLFFRNKKTISNGVRLNYSTINNGYKIHYFNSFEASKFSTITNVSIKSFGDLKMGGWRPHGYSEWGQVYHYVDDEGVVCNPDPNVQKGTAYTQYDLFNKMIFKISNNHKITSNLQYSSTSNIPRFDKLNDGDSYSHGDSLKFHSYYYGPQERLFTSVKLNSLTSPLKSELILAYQKVKESRHKWYLNDFLAHINNDVLDDDNLPTSQHETVNIYSLNTNHQKGKWSFGTETFFNHVESKSTNSGNNIWDAGDTRYPPEGSNFFSSAVYTAFFHRFSHKIQLEAGWRYTFSQIKGKYPDEMQRPIANIEGLSLTSRNHIASGNLKLVYYPKDSWKISSVTARGFHTPNIDDMLKVFQKSNIITIPNIELNPEYSLSQELSITKNLNDKIILFGNGFYTRLFNGIVKDSIAWYHNLDHEHQWPAWEVDYDDEIYPTYANQNSENPIDLYGFTVGIRGEINGFNINMDYNTSTAVHHGRNSPTVAHIPPSFGKIEILKNFSRIDIKTLFLFSGEKKVEDYDDAEVDNLDETPFITHEDGTTEFLGLPRWSVLNISLLYRISSDLRIQLGVENIFDRHYKTFASGISAPGRNLFFDVNFLF